VGGLTVAGGGTLVLTAANTYTGGTIVSGGVLEVGADATGSIAGPVTVSAGGTLGGYGWIVGAVTNNGGTVLPGGTSGRLGALTVTGPYTQTASSTLAVEVAPSGAALLNVTGAATIAGTLQLTFDPGVYTATTEPLLDAAGGLSGTFGTVTASGSPLMQYSISYTADTVNLVIGDPFSFASFAQTPNQMEVARILDNALPGASGDLLTVYDSLFLLSTGAQLRAAYDALAGVLYTALPTVTAEDAQTAMGLIFQHLDDVERAGSGGPAAVTAVAPAGGSAGVPGPVSWAGAGPGDPSGWLTPLTRTDVVQGSGTAPGYTSQSTGALFGYDRDAGGGLTWGYALGGWQSTVALADGSGTTAGITTVAVATYGAYTAGAFEAKGVLGYGVNTIQGTRQIAFGDLARTATASLTGDEFMAGVEAAYRLQMGALTVRPTLGLQYVSGTEPGFTEQGANSVDLGVGATSAAWLRALAGVRLEYTTTTAAGAQLTYDFHAEYSQLLSTPLPQIQSTLLGATGSGVFTTTGVTAAPNALGLGLRVLLHQSDRYDLYAGYDAMLSSNETDQTYSAGVLIHF